MTLAQDQNGGPVLPVLSTDTVTIQRNGVSKTVPLAQFAAGVAASAAAALGLPPLAVVTLVDAATINTDASLGNVFNVTLAGNRTLANPTNLSPGVIYTFLIKQDATGSRTLTYDTLFKFAAGTPPTLTLTADATDRLTCVYNGVDMLITTATLAIA